jgi:menaquinone-specific isochorismate synthase
LYLQVRKGQWLTGTAVHRIKKPWVGRARFLTSGDIYDIIILEIFEYTERIVKLMIKPQNSSDIKETIKHRFIEASRSIGPETRSYLFNRIQIEIPPLNPLIWLKNQPDEIKIYLSDREKQDQLAGIGQVDRFIESDEADFLALFPEMRRRIALSHNQIKYLGGITFNLNQVLDETWASFGKYHFLIPRFEIFTQDGQTFLAGNYRVTSEKNGQGDLEALCQELEALDFGGPTAPAPPPYLKGRTDLPDQANWHQNVSQAVHLINTSSLNKIVLARKTTLKLSHAPNPIDLLIHLKRGSTGSFDFCFQVAPHLAFLGSTPELLYRRNGQTIASEAIAGTRPKGKNAQEERIFFEELINSTKDQQEHQVVVDSILATLQCLCHKVEILKKAEVLKLSLVQHLYSQFTGQLNPTSQDEDILMALHPTPSVLGAPKPQAFQDLVWLEPYTRGWYAGPIGWVGRNEAMFMVGIRSGLLNGKEISLFSGAGIVGGSDPAKEWDEIDNKLQQFLRIFPLKQTSPAPNLTQTPWPGHLLGISSVKNRLV